MGQGKPWRSISGPSHFICYIMGRIDVAVAADGKKIAVEERNRDCLWDYGRGCIEEGWIQEENGDMMQFHRS